MIKPVRIHDVVRIEERDYCYGVGTLTLRVTERPTVGRQADGDWIVLRGKEVRWNGEEGSIREVLVRPSALANPQSRSNVRSPRGGVGG
jgi:hypothetical protein